MSKLTPIEIHTGLGTGKKIIWRGCAEHLPRAGETVVVKKVIYHVEWVRHYMGTLEVTKVEIYVRYRD